MFQNSLMQIIQDGVDRNVTVMLGGRYTQGHLHNSPAGPCKSMRFPTKHLQCKHTLLCMTFKWGREEERGNEVGGGSGVRFEKRKQRSGLWRTPRWIYLEAKRTFVHTLTYSLNKPLVAQPICAGFFRVSLLFKFHPLKKLLLAFLRVFITIGVVQLFDCWLDEPQNPRARKVLSLTFLKNTSLAI